MATLIVSTTTDFSDDILINVDFVDFRNPFLTTATATFSMTQFDNVQISTEATFSGSSGVSHLVLNQASNVVLSLLTFTDWGFGRVTVNGTGGNDRIEGAAVEATYYGLGGNDRIIGYNSPVHAFGGDGRDYIALGSGSVDGGRGIDTVDLQFSSIVEINVDLSDGGGGRDIGNGITLTNVEALDIQCSLYNDTLIGGRGNDRFRGGMGDDILDGRGGNDVLIAGGGKNVLSGGAGADVLVTGDEVFGASKVDSNRLSGGSGADRFVFFFDDYSAMKPSGASVITDFQQGKDRLELGMTGADPDELAFIGETAFFNRLGSSDLQIRWQHVKGDTVIQVGNTEDIFYQARLKGIFDLTGDDFIL